MKLTVFLSFMFSYVPINIVTYNTEGFVLIEEFYYDTVY